VNWLDKPFWAVFLTIAIIGAINMACHLGAQLSPSDPQLQRGRDDPAGGKERTGFQSSTGSVHHLVAEWDKECEAVATLTDDLAAAWGMQIGTAPFKWGWKGLFAGV